VDVDAVDGAAALASVVERSIGDGGGGGLDVLHVLAHVHRRLSSHLQLCLDETLVSELLDAMSDLRASREEDSVDR